MSLREFQVHCICRFFQNIFSVKRKKIAIENMFFGTTNATTNNTQYKYNVNDKTPKQGQ